MEGSTPLKDTHTKKYYINKNYTEVYIVQYTDEKRVASVFLCSCLTALVIFSNIHFLLSDNVCFQNSLQ